MNNLNNKREQLTVHLRRSRRGEDITLKRGAAMAMCIPSLNITTQEILHLIQSLINDEPQTYRSLSQISCDPQVVALLTSDDHSDQLFHLLNNLEHPNDIVRQGCLVTVDQVEFLMGYDLLDLLMGSLTHKSPTIRELTCWILSNIAGEGESYATSLLNNFRFVESINKMLMNDKRGVRLQVLYIIRNIIQNAQQVFVINYLSEDDFFVALRTVVREQSREFQKLAISVIRMVIQMGKELAGDQNNLLKIKMEKLGLMDIIEALDQEQLVQFQ